MSAGLYPVGTVAVAATKVAAGGSPDVTVSITGVSASAAAGALVAAVAVAVSGASATGSVGTVTASVTGDVTVAITGVSATASVGAIAGNVSYAATGVSSSCAVGSVGSLVSVALSGVSGSGVAGTVGTSGGVLSVRTKGLRKTRYVPADPPASVSELPRFLKQEHERLTDALEAPFTHQLLEKLTVEPSRKPSSAAVIAYADGTSWNPGSGEGIYAYYGGSWKKLG